MTQLLAMANSNHVPETVSNMEGIMADLAKRSPDHMQMSDVEAANAEFRKANEGAILVSPATSVRTLPEGTEVAFSRLFVDTNKDSGEVYDVGGGKWGLGRVVLDKIAAQAGVTWDPVQSRRLDDGSDPHYCVYHAVGTYRQFDGSTVQIMGTKEMDLRDGSAQVEALVERYQQKLDRWERDRKGYPPKDPRSGQIREMRLHILAHAETKARLRAIRAMGIKSSYSLQELKKPFVVARLMWTGHSEDPELRKLAFQMRAMQMTGAGLAMFGGGMPAMQAAAALPSAAPVGPALPAPAAPPPVGGGLDEDDFGYEDHTSHRGTEPAPPPMKTACPPDGPSHPADDYGDYGPPPDEPPAGDEPCIEFGKNEGVPLSQLADRQLDWYIRTAKEELGDDSKSKFHDITQRRLNGYMAEKNRRQSAA